MTAFLPLLAVAAAAAAAVLLHHFLPKVGHRVSWITLYLTFVLPFAAGGFQTYIAMVTSVCLLVFLAGAVRKQGYLNVAYNLNTLAVLCVVGAYCITPLWAADKGMAVFGILRYLPVLLFALVLMQHSPEQREDFLTLIPLCGACMTVFSCILLLFPGARNHVSVNGRLCGFLQYPNTYAAFALAGIVLNGIRSRNSRWGWSIDAVLIFGILLSGSRTAFVLLILALLGIMVIRKNVRAIHAACRKISNQFLSHTSFSFFIL